MNVVNSQVDISTEQSDQLLSERLHESQVLLGILQRLATSTDLNTILQQIVDASVLLIDHAERAVIHVLDPKTFSLQALTVAGKDQQKIKKPFSFRSGEGIAGKALQAGKSIRISDVTKESSFLPVKENPSRIASLMVTPVMTDERKLGVLSVHSSQPDAFNSEDEHLLNVLAINAALALDKAQLLDTTRARLDESNVLYSILQEVVDSDNVNEAIEKVVDSLHDHFGYSHIDAFLRDPNKGDLYYCYGSGDVGRELFEQGYRIPSGKGIIGHVFETGQPFMTNDVRQVVFYMPNPILSDITAELAVPICGDDCFLGVLDLQCQSPGFFQEHDLRLVMAVANQLGIVVEKLNIYSDLQAALNHEKTVRAQLVQAEKLAALGRIVATVAHELNNPLQALQNALYLIKVTEHLQLETREDVQIALDEANRMADIIARLRDTYRPVTSLEYRLESLNDIILDVRKLLAAHLDRHEIRARFDLDSGLPLIPVIRDQIKQVILNISLNAVEAMPNGGRLIVRTRFSPRRSRIYFSISDTGPGIPEGILPDIFDPFVTTKEMGTGLGLSISNDIVRGHNGVIDVESSNKGTTFTIWLPLERM